MKKYNVLWVFIDSVRRYYCEDDRSRLKYMDEFAETAVEFKNVVTSAPSTYMSMSAMMTGWHSYFINRNFQDFTFDSEQFLSLPNILKSIGYENYNFWMHPMSRAYMAKILPVVDKSYWPADFKSNDWWTNRQIIRLVENTLKKSVDSKAPKFFFVDFNCRKDPEINDCVKSVFELFKKYGYDDSNSVMVLCSDHGYPDPKKAEGNPLYYAKMNLSHDLILTDDNIMIPMFIRYPGCAKGKKIETTIGSIDIMPTLVDILGYKNEKLESAHGRSLKNLIETGNKQELTKRFQRCDSRFAMQSGKATALRNDDYKYIFYHDDIRNKGNEELFDLRKNPEETINCINSPEYAADLETFRREYQASEQQAMKFQLNYLFDRFSKRYHTLIKNATKIMVTDSCNPIFADMIIQMCKKITPSVKGYLLKVEHNADEFENFDEIINAGTKSWSHVQPLAVSYSFSIIIVPFNNSENRDNPAMKKIVKKIKSEKNIWLDYNMEMPSSLWHKFSLFKIKRWILLIRTNPKIAFKQIKNKLLRR